MKKILQFTFIFIFIFLYLISLLIFSCMIPSSLLRDNIQISSDVLYQEGNLNYINLITHNLIFDNYTDALMINTAYSIDSNRPFYSAMIARKNYIPSVTNVTYIDSVGELPVSEKYYQSNQVAELQDTLNEDITESFMYARYWHGYLIFLRPLLYFFNILDLRIIMSILLLILLFYLCCLIYEKISKKLCFLFFIFFILFDYFLFGLSMQGFIIIIISLLFSIVILAKGEKIYSKLSFLFFIVGMLTSFFDLLTTPILTLSLPLLMYYLLKEKVNPYNKVTDFLKSFFKYCFAWFVGFALTWCSKWVLVDLFYNLGLINTSIHQIIYRTSGSLIDNFKPTGFLAILENIYNAKSAFFITIITIILLILYHLKNFLIGLFSKPIKHLKLNYKSTFIYFCIGILPIIWYLILANHSYLHGFFTYRSLIVTFICAIIIMYKLFYTNKKHP